MNKSISVIIPCHNVDKQILSFVHSIQDQVLNQDYLEFLFIDLSSTDKTWNTLLEVKALNENNINIIHCDTASNQESAYNLGILNAASDYVIFSSLFSPSWEIAYQLSQIQETFEFDLAIPKCINENTCAKQKSIDLSIMNFITFNDNSLLSIDSRETRQNLIITASIESSVFNKLFRKSFLTENNISFIENQWCGELLFLIQNYIYAKQIHIYDSNIYIDAYYNRRQISDINFDYIDVVKYCMEWWDILVTQNLFGKYYNELEFLFINECYLKNLMHLFDCSNSALMDSFSYLKKEIIKRNIDFKKNPYIPLFNSFCQLLFPLLEMSVSKNQLTQIKLNGKIYWNNITIYMATHVKFTAPKDIIYQPIQVGRANADDLGYLCDNIGVNISHLNRYYSELTALYWIWKNESTSDYVGLCHYRRYFINTNTQDPLTKKEYMQLLSEYDIIISEPIYLLDESFYTHYAKAHNSEDLKAVAYVLEQYYPEYAAYYNNLIYGKYTIIGNLFVTSKYLLDKYASWLFAVFDKVSKIIDPDIYDSYHKRVYGFLSEHLLMVWINANNLHWYGCNILISQEKPESITLRNNLYVAIVNQEYSNGIDHFKNYISNRPDVVLIDSDISQTILPLYVILYLGLTYPNTRFLNNIDSLSNLIERFKAVAYIISHLLTDCINEEDILILESYSMSLETLSELLTTADYYPEVSYYLMRYIENSVHP